MNFTITKIFNFYWSNVKTVIAKIYCASTFIKNTTILSNCNSQHQVDLIYLYRIIFTVENVRITNNTITDSNTGYHSIINAELSYLKYKKYNEISQNSANYAIKTLAIHMCENSILNISSNTWNYNVEIYSTKTIEIAEMEICTIQYISERGNLDREFQMGQKLNYLIISNNNNNSYNEHGISISNIDLNHCEWEQTSESAFLTSSPLYVNQQFIQQNFL